VPHGSLGDAGRGRVDARGVFSHHAVTGRRVSPPGAEAT
jgi:hypothetical protein